MGKKRRNDDRLDSYLSTSELLELVGITRKALRVYEREGVCAPALVKSDYYKYWTLGQAVQLREIHELSQGGMPVRDIAKVAHAPGAALHELSYQQAVSLERKNRRRIKGLWMQRLAAEGRRHLETTLNVGSKTAAGTGGIGDADGGYDAEGDWYLRYLPQRWLALVPVFPHTAEFATPKQFMEAYRHLSEVVELVGWAGSPLMGQVSSIAGPSSTAGSAGKESARAGSSYVYLQLANAPMPVPIGRRPADSGCYLAISGNAGSAFCSARHCEECALYGRIPSDEERAHWESAQEEARARGFDLHDRTVMVDELDSPYLSGAWSVYTKHKLDPDSDAFKLGVHGTTLRPRLMPHETPLPYGVTACVLPQGVYLCRTCPSTHAHDALAAMRARLESLDADPITPEQERASVQKAQAEHDRSGAALRIGYGFDHDQVGADIPAQRGFSREPLAAVLAEYEPELRNWSRRVTEDEFARMRLVTNAALAPEDGYTIVASRLPEPVAPHGAFELQALVHTEDVLD